MKAEIISLVVLASIIAMLSNGTMATNFANMGTNEVYLAFSLVFTFVVGMEVIK